MDATSNFNSIRPKDGGSCVVSFIAVGNADADADRRRCTQIRSRRREFTYRPGLRLPKLARLGPGVESGSGTGIVEYYLRYLVARWNGVLGALFSPYHTRETRRPLGRWERWGRWGRWDSPSTKHLDDS